MKHRLALVLVAAASVGIGSLATAPGGAVAAPSTSPDAGQEQRSVEDKDTTVSTVPFSAPVRLEDAVGVGARQSEPVIGYRFENPQVVGEYFVSADQTPSEFVESFELMYDTEPQVVAALVERPMPNAESRSTGPAPVIDTGLAPFVPPLVPLEVAQARMDKMKVDAASPEARAVAATDWRPSACSRPRCEMGRASTLPTTSTGKTELAKFRVRSVSKCRSTWTTGRQELGVGCLCVGLISEMTSSRKTTT